MMRYLISLGTIAVFASALGCSSNVSTERANVSAEPSSEGAAYLLSSAPEDAQDVIPALEAAEDEQEVVVIGRIGGSTNPWVEGRAAFSLVDRSLAACTDIHRRRVPHTLGLLLCHRPVAGCQDAGQVR